LDGHFAILPDASVLALKSAILTRGQYNTKRPAHFACRRVIKKLFLTRSFLHLWLEEEHEGIQEGKENVSNDWNP
jgi:hypothetical protein